MYCVNGYLDVHALWYVDVANPCVRGTKPFSSVKDNVLHFYYCLIKCYIWCGIRFKNFRNKPQVNRLFKNRIALLKSFQSTITLRLSFQSESSVSGTELRDH